MATYTYSARARRLGAAVQNFLKDESGRLAKAVHRSISEGLFPQDDVHFALEHLRQSVTAEKLESWVHSVLYDDGIPAGNPAEPDMKSRVLCLHAGNLPLVGLQDVIAVLLTGAKYHGKISRKDAFLLPALLDFLKQKGGFGQLHYNTDLDDFNELHADTVMFSGSKRSVPEVTKRLREGRMMQAGARLLVRTAHSSAAYIDPDAITLKDKNALFEALFQYQGKGCRSLNAVFSPDAKGLLSLIEEEKQRGFKQQRYVRNVVLPQQLSPELRYLAAFNKAIQRPYVSVGNFVIQISDPQPETEGLITLTPRSEPGLEQQIKDFIASCGTGFQSLYTHHPEHLKQQKLPFEPLWQAQRPPVNWKPDGVNTLHWLLSPHLEQVIDQSG